MAQSIAGLRLLRLEHLCARGGLYQTESTQLLIHMQYVVCSLCFQVHLLSLRHSEAEERG